MEESAHSAASEAFTKPKVTGIGGIFFFSENPSQTKAWYAENLGLETDAYGVLFASRDFHQPEKTNYLQWSFFEKGSAYFSPSTKEFMVNYRVQHLEALLQKLRENGVTILDEIQHYEYGKFLHILDPEGNKIESWEPVDEGLDKSEGKTAK
ncbi:MAG: VOC family protein [Microscillaceae bacterium]